MEKWYLPLGFVVWFGGTVVTVATVFVVWRYFTDNPGAAGNVLIAAGVLAIASALLAQLGTEAVTSAGTAIVMIVALCMVLWIVYKFIRLIGKALF